MTLIYLVLYRLAKELKDEKLADEISETYLINKYAPEEDKSKHNSEVNIFEAENPKYKKLEYAIFLEQKFEVTQVAKLYVEVFKKLFALQPETFFTTDLGLKIGLTKNLDENGLKQAVAINDTYFIESHINNNGKFNRIKYALTIFELEDELIIKYAKS